MAAPDPLAALHAIREPALAAEPLATTLAVAVAAGVAAALLLVAAVLAVRLARHRLLGHVGPRRRARAALVETTTLPPDERLAAQARLLRRFVAGVGGDETAAARGDAWLAALDRAFATTVFTAGPGRIFADGLYGPVDAAAAQAADRCLRRLLGVGERGAAR